MQISRLVTSLQLSGCILASASHAHDAGANALVNSSRESLALANSGDRLIPVANLYQAPRIPLFSLDIARHANSTWTNFAWDKPWASLTCTNLARANLTGDVARDDAASNPSCRWRDLAASDPEEVN
jgi:hypothetical protein